MSQDGACAAASAAAGGGSADYVRVRKPPLRLEYDDGRDTFAQDMSQDKRNNALLEAAKKGDAAKCKELVDAGAEVNCRADTMVRAQGRGELRIEGGGKGKL